MKLVVVTLGERGVRFAVASGLPCDPLRWAAIATARGGTAQPASGSEEETPRDLSLISFDNTPIVRFTQPPLTAVDQPIAATASRAAELLIEAVKNGICQREVVSVSGDLIERSSTAPPPT